MRSIRSPGHQFINLSVHQFISSAEVTTHLCATQSFLLQGVVYRQKLYNHNHNHKTEKHYFISHLLLAFPSSAPFSFRTLTLVDGTPFVSSSASGSGARDRFIFAGVGLGGLLQLVLALREGFFYQRFFLFLYTRLMQQQRAVACQDAEGTATITRPTSGH
jgi:hypothetical protein